MTTPSFLLGVAIEHVLARLRAAAGKEFASGKFASPQSSAALAVNTFGFFVERPFDLPAIPGLELDPPARRVDVEYCARFPWRGGRHPWLDAVVETSTHLVGVESKRYEPFRDRKHATLSDAYLRKVWGDAMGPFEAMRDTLRDEPEAFRYLDAAQLVKHAFGLVTDGARHAKSPVLLYLYAEPPSLDGKPIADAARAAHREEIARFASAVTAAAVRFHAISYREWLASWPADGEVGAHARAIAERFAV